MRTTFIFVLIICLFSLSVYSKNGKTGLSYSLNGGTNVLRFQNVDGAGSNSITTAHGVGILYLHPISNWLELESGLNYSWMNVKYSWLNMDFSKTNETSYSNVSLLNIPIGVRTNFLKYFFANGGLLFDFDVNRDSNSTVDNQTGIGLMFGLGIKYDFKFGGSLFINPYGKLHSLIPFFPSNYQEHIVESGARFGFTYQL